MKRQRTNVIVCGTVFLLLVLSGCNNEQNVIFSNPTLPDSATSLSNFYADETKETGFGVYKGHEYFLIQVPAGEYLLQYITRIGQFYIAFRAEKNAVLHIGLSAGDDAQSATVYRGRVTNASVSRSFGVVTVFSEEGATGTGEHLFAKSENNGVLLIGGIGIEYTPGSSYFKLHIPVGGTYRLTYITEKGRFEIEFTVEDNAIKEIGLSDGDVVREAYILKK
ncbi:hypothetical protein U14_00769 [Candidatus Moduliflexus flocculans]|uniref:Lipoprotein n=1 Tax=Candidatus Moduliflexus flocculans TaxID=1499966 RepID=A0A0S6VQQ4_9BACT|nr:hypothetical protein U14_00769 [Candidatus Moduliflexus flocculans]